MRRYLTTEGCFSVSELDRSLVSFFCTYRRRGCMPKSSTPVAPSYTEKHLQQSRRPSVVKRVARLSFAGRSTSVPWACVPKSGPSSLVSRILLRCVIAVGTGRARVAFQAFIMVLFTGHSYWRISSYQLEILIARIHLTDLP